jgi:hypothetical protein
MKRYVTENFDRALLPVLEYCFDSCQMGVVGKIEMEFLHAYVQAKV